jgi:hypothetical protein
VFERCDPANRGKGHALAYAFSLLRPESFDAYIILDADTLVGEDLLAAMDRYLHAGHRIIQAHYDVLNPFESRRTTLMYVALRIFNYVRPLGRRTLGLSTGLQGNGMCFAKPVIERYAWNAFSLAEDIEYTTTLVLNGERVVFAPEAQVWAQMPVAPSWDWTRPSVVPPQAHVRRSEGDCSSNSPRPVGADEAGRARRFLARKRSGINPRSASVQDLLFAGRLARMVMSFPAGFRLDEPASVAAPA